jgi:hypothetical protein
MHELSSLNSSFSSYLKDLILSTTFSDIWTINKTHDILLAHELKMRFLKPFKFRAQAIFNAAKKRHRLALENLSLRNFFVQTIYIYQRYQKV